MPPLVYPDYWHGRRVVVTGHTGFKGAWLTLWLHAMGAEVTGIADGVPTNPSLYELTHAADGIVDLRIDVRDHSALRDAMVSAMPEVVIHMAAQSLVRRSFVDPRETYETNVMGTVNVLEAVRFTPSIRVVLNVTSDKCYENSGACRSRPFVEGDPMGGHDPYSSSKGCAELVADAYARSFFAADALREGPRLGCVRAGNVIGGGDWGRDRLIPDIMGGALSGTPIPIRSPLSVRPWQHVLNPLSGYLRLAQVLHSSAEHQGGWNFGPALEDARPVSWLADRLDELWPSPLHWEVAPGPHPYEARFLALDSTKARERLGWTPTWDLDQAIDAVAQWYQVFAAGKPVREITLAQIEAFTAGASPA